MARFLGETEGSRGPASRLGGAQSGIRSDARGWDLGVRVYGRADGDRDVFDIYVTSGSHASSSPILLGTVTRAADDGRIVFAPDPAAEEIIAL